MRTRDKQTMLNSCHCSQNLHIDGTLPYELRALEAGLAVAIRIFEAEVGDLESKTLPSLEYLTQKVGFLQSGVDIH